MIGWTSLRTAMPSWGITTEQDLSAWLRRHGFPGLQLGNHISARAQEFVLAGGCRFDAPVAMLEAVFVTTTLEFGRQTIPAREQPNEILTGSARDQGRSLRDPTIPNLDFFDDLDLEELFAERVPMLKSCPHFFRGRLRNSFRVALEERHRAEGEGDELAEERAWNSSHLSMGLSVGRDELAARGELFVRGRWRELLASTRNSIPTGTQKTSLPGARRNEEAWQPRSACRRARSHEPGRNWSVRHWLPKKEETLRELRERRPQVASREILREVLDFTPPAPLELNFMLFSNCLRSAPAGHQKVCLDDQETLQLLYCAADEFARGDVLRGVGHCFNAGDFDGLAEEGRWREMHRHRHHVSLVGCQDRSNSANRSKQRVLHSSSRCPLGPESTAWGMQCES